MFCSILLALLRGKAFSAFRSAHPQKCRSPLIHCAGQRRIYRVAQGTSRERTFSQRLKRYSSYSKRPPSDPQSCNVLRAGFRNLSQPFKFITDSSPLTKCLIHFGIGYWVFSHYIAKSRLTYGPSMLPTFAVSGDVALVCWLYGNGASVEPGDLISYQHPIHRGEQAIKRVIALEGDYVLRDTPGGLNGTNASAEGPAQHENAHGARVDKDPIMTKVPEGHCWVVGDNLGWSRDSRMYGPIPLALIRGKVLAIKGGSWSLSKWRLV